MKGEDIQEDGMVSNSQKRTSKISAEWSFGPQPVQGPDHPVLCKRVPRSSDGSRSRPRPPEPSPSMLRGIDMAWHRVASAAG